MWRTSAVRSMLLEKVAGLPAADPESGEDDGGLGPDFERTRRRAVFMVALDWIAILILVLLDPSPPTRLALGPFEGTVFTLAILAVAVHSGFRLGQLEKLNAIRRLARDLGRFTGDD